MSFLRTSMSDRSRNCTEQQAWCCRPYPASASEIPRYLPRTNEEIQACLVCLRRRDPAIAIKDNASDPLDPDTAKKRKGQPLDCWFSSEPGARTLPLGQFHDKLPRDSGAALCWTFRTAERPNGTHSDQLPDAAVGPLNEHLENLTNDQTLESRTENRERGIPPILCCHMKKHTTVVVGDEHVTYHNGKRHSVVVLLRRTSSSLSDSAARVGVVGKVVVDKAGILVQRVLQHSKRRASGKSHSR